MKKTLLKLSTAAIALAIITVPPSSVMAQESKEEAVAQAAKAAAPKTVDADPALWVVKDEDTTIYMLGTVHFLKPGMTWFDEAVKDAFDVSDSLVLEIKPGNPADDQKIFTKYAIDNSGVTARSKLNETQQKSYAKAMEKLGFPLTALDPFKPWAAGLVMQVTALQKVGFDPNTGVEKILEGAANAVNKEIIGLETTDYQLGIFDSFSDANQKLFLTQTLDDIDNIENGLDELVDLWAKGAPEKLGEILQRDLAEPEIRQKLLTTRNANWAKWINARMDKPGTVFMAVGAGHLAGPADVKSLLTAYGINAERINY